MFQIITSCAWRYSSHYTNCSFHFDRTSVVSIANPEVQVGRRDERALPRNRISDTAPPRQQETLHYWKRHRYVRDPFSTILRSSTLPFTQISHSCCSADPISCSPPSSLQRPVIGLALSDSSPFEPHPHPLHLRRVPQLLLLPSSLQPL